MCIIPYSFPVEGLKHGAVASDHTVCSDVGKMILLRGGNAVDAAIATTLCLGVANPASSGIGGGMFMVIYADRKHHEERWTKAMNKNSTVSTVQRPDFIDARNDSSLRATFQESKMIEVIDAREVAPEGAYRDMFLVNHETMASEKGGLAIAVLGELRGLELAHARHGALDWAVLVEPAMRLARDGVPITKHLAQDIANQKNNIAKYGLIGLGKLLTRDGRGQTMLKEGDLIQNPTLAKTLEAVMKDGADAVYKGELAKSLVKDIQDAGGIITENDLHQYKATLRSPLISEASGFTIVGVPPPSSGGATIIGILRFLSGFSAPLATMADTLSKHRLVEAIRHAFAIRMSLSDPDYFTNVTLDATNDLINGNYMEELRQKLYRDNETAPISVFGGPKWAQLKDGEGEVKPKDAHEGDRRQLSFRQKRKLFRTFGYLEDHGTTHLSIIDSQGNAVSLTSTVNTYFGSGVVSESTGIVLNNQMDGKFRVASRS
jgi:gamma-glutamyltranspeptidase